MKKAARDMGLGDDWRAALERVKTLHVEPGQAAGPDSRSRARGRGLRRDRTTSSRVPPLAKEIWRMQMMSPERQRVNPFFIGGEVISVSFPTDGMAQDDKLMSLRGNNIHFARATVHPRAHPRPSPPGLHDGPLQPPPQPRSRRRSGCEGWSLYWEMLLWDRGFAATPENRVGMLFWRDAPGRAHHLLAALPPGRVDAAAVHRLPGRPASVTSARTPRPRCGDRSTAPILRSTSSPT